MRHIEADYGERLFNFIHRVIKESKDGVTIAKFNEVEFLVHGNSRYEDISSIYHLTYELDKLKGLIHERHLYCYIQP